MACQYNNRDPSIKLIKGDLFNGIKVPDGIRITLFPDWSKSKNNIFFVLLTYQFECNIRSLVIPRHTEKSAKRTSLPPIKQNSTYRNSQNSKNPPPINCNAIVRKTGFACTNPAKYRDGKCGVHTMIKNPAGLYGRP